MSIHNSSLVTYIRKQSRKYYIQDRDMKLKINLLTVIGCIILLTSSRAIFAEAAGSSALSLSMKIDHRSYQTGQPIELKIILQNHSSHRFYIDASQWYLSCFNVHLFNQHGQSVPLTRLGQNVFSEPMLISWKFPTNNYPEIKQYTVCLSQLFDLTLPGKYTLSCTSNMRLQYENHSHILHSNILHFTVLQKPKYVNGISAYTHPTTSRRYLFACSDITNLPTKPHLICRFECSSHGEPAWCIQNNSIGGNENYWEYVSPNQKYLYIGSYEKACIYQYRILPYGHLKPLQPITPVQMIPVQFRPMCRGNELIYDQYNSPAIVYHIGKNGQLYLDEEAGAAIHNSFSYFKRLSALTSSTTECNYTNLSSLPLGTLVFSPTHTAFADNGKLITFRVLPHNRISILPQPGLTKALDSNSAVEFMKLDKPAHILILGVEENVAPGKMFPVYVHHLVSLHIEAGGLLKPVSNLKLPASSPGNLEPYQISKLFLTSTGKYLLAVCNYSGVILLYHIASDGKLRLVENWNKMNTNQAPYLWNHDHLYCCVKYQLSDITVSKEGRLVARPLVYPDSDNTYDIDGLATAVEPTPPVWNKFPDGLAVSLRMNPHTYQVGSPIEITVRLKNQSNTTIRLGNRTSGKCALQLQITRGRAVDAGNNIATNEPVSSIDNLLGAGIALQNAATSPLGLITLRPHQHLEFHFYINTLADCTIGGDYYVSVCLNDATDHPMISRIEQFKVLSTIPIKVTTYLHNSGVVSPQPERISRLTSPKH